MIRERAYDDHTCGSQPSGQAVGFCAKSVWQGRSAALTGRQFRPIAITVDSIKIVSGELIMSLHDRRLVRLLRQSKLGLSALIKISFVSFHSASACS